MGLDNAMIDTTQERLDQATSSTEQVRIASEFALQQLGATSAEPIHARTATAIVACSVASEVGRRSAPARCTATSARSSCGR